MAVREECMTKGSHEVVNVRPLVFGSQAGYGVGAENLLQVGRQNRGESWR